MVTRPAPAVIVPLTVTFPPLPRVPVDVRVIGPLAETEANERLAELAMSTKLPEPLTAIVVDTAAPFRAFPACSNNPVVGVTGTSSCRSCSAVSETVVGVPEAAFLRVVGTVMLPPANSPRMSYRPVDWITRFSAVQSPIDTSSAATIFRVLVAPEREVDPRRIWPCAASVRLPVIGAIVA